MGWSQWLALAFPPWSLCSLVHLYSLFALTCTSNDIFLFYMDGNSVGQLILILVPPMLTSLSQRTSTCPEDPTLLPNLQPIIVCSTSLSNNEPRYSAALVRLEWLACLGSLSADHRHNAMAWIQLELVSLQCIGAHIVACNSLLCPSLISECFKLTFSDKKYSWWWRQW